ncbi:MAG: conserved repeat domain protein [Ilumatobacteraceae bacterium]|nr:conserved repeat domain protein [Ilumatobacteraceae bacterium]
MAARSGDRSQAWRRWGIALAVVGLAGSGALAPVAAGAVDPSADLSVSMTHTPDTATAPTQITVRVTASNAGPDSAEGVVAGLGFQYPLELRTVPGGCKRSSSYESVVCELGDVAPGSSASVDVVLTAPGSGLFTLPAVVASDTADPDSADRSTTDSILVKAGPSQAVRYIRGTFPAMMNRNPDTATTNYWAAKWKAEYFRYPRDLAKIPLGIMNSNEYRRLRIRESYQRILGRTADTASLAYWMDKAAAGRSYEAIDTVLLSSREFFRNGDEEASIRKTFVAVLGRQPTQAELDRWQKAITPSTDRAILPRSLQRSTEGYDVIIGQRYQAALGKAPSNLGRYFWILELRKGTSPESLFAQLLVSPEVVQKYPFTPDDYEEEYEYLAVPASDVQAAVDAAA